MKLSLITDQAIGETDGRSVDGLGFEAYSRVLAGAARDTRGPFTIGVFGEWGTGKTSLLRLIERRLSAEDNTVTVWFNAWRYERDEHPIIPLVGTIVQALESRQTRGKKLGDAAVSLIKALRAIAYGFSAKSTFKMPGFAEVEASFVAKDMIDRSDSLRNDPLLDRSLYYGAFNNLDSLKLRTDLKIVIIIDDLDRCFPDQAIRLLESIKLVLSQPGFIFVLGVARQVIESYLQHRYSTEFGIANFQGQLYLDKIVQLPFHLPPSGGRLTEFSKTLLADQPQLIIDSLEQVLPIVGEALGGNPRAIIRFINNILIDNAINSAVAEREREAPLDLRYFAITRCLEHRWPDVFSTLINSNDLSTEVAIWDRTGYTTYVAEGGDKALVAGALLSDRNLEKLLSSAAGQEWLKNSVARDASFTFLLSQNRLSPLDAAEAKLEWDYYVSYSMFDVNLVAQLVEKMVTAGLKVFFDASELKIGSDIAKSLDQAVLAASAVLVCVGGANSEHSHGRQREIDAFLAREPELPLIPVLLPGADTSSLPPVLQDRQWLDIRQGITDDAVNKLLRAVSRGRTR